MGTSLYFKYPPESLFGGKRTLNIGCGYAQYRTPNVVNLDAYDRCKPDVVWDLEHMPLPFEDNSFDLILANHILEHVRGGWALFAECGRVLKPNGRMEIYVPGNGSDSIRGYRDHVAQISAEWFAGTFANYRSGGNAWADEHVNDYAIRMKLVKTCSVMQKYWWLRGPYFWKSFCANHLRNTVLEQGFTFRKVTEEEFHSEKAAYEKRMSGILPMLPVQSADVL